MDRDPLVVVLLKIPFKLAVITKDFASAIIAVFLKTFIELVIGLLSLVEFRKSIGQLLLSGLLKVLVVFILLYGFSYPLY